MFTVVVAESDAVVRMLVSQNAESLGLRVLLAADGAQAVTLLETVPDVRLLITAVNLPAVDGVSLITWVRSSGTNSDLPILAFGEPRIREAFRLLDAGANRFLPRPLTARALKAEVRELLPFLPSENATAVALSTEPTRTRVLFVEDDETMRVNLKARLLTRHHKWDLVFAHSAKQALAFLDRQEFDVMVADLEMAGTKRKTLLDNAREFHPDVVRIALAGPFQVDTSYRTIPTAHRVLPRPCRMDHLDEAVGRACHLRELIHCDRTLQLVEQMGTLPAVPGLYNAVTEALSRRNAGAKEVADIVSTDVATTAKLLQLVNSPYFAAAAPIANVHRAVVRFGVNFVRNLVLAIEVFGGGEMAAGLPLASLQQHSLLTASTARSLVADHRMKGDAFIGGLLHDVGHLVLARGAPQRRPQVQRHSWKNKVTMHEAERELFGATHAEIGAYLLWLWGLPYQVVEAVACHHAPLAMPGANFDATAAVHVAAALAHHALRPHAPPDVTLDQGYLAALDVADQVPIWQDMVEERAGQRILLA